MGSNHLKPLEVLPTRDNTLLHFLIVDYSDYGPSDSVNFLCLIFEEPDVDAMFVIWPKQQFYPKWMYTEANKNYYFIWISLDTRWIQTAQL